MNDPINPKTTGTDSNSDPLTGEPGAHPVGVGAGAAAVGAAGAAIGALAGPIGVVAGAAIGAVAGGLAGKSVAESIDPTRENNYWQANHANQPYAADSGYDQYSHAYRTGYEGAGAHGLDKGYDEVEGDLQSTYEKSKESASVTWDHAKHAVRAAYDRARDGVKKA